MAAIKFQTVRFSDLTLSAEDQPSRSNLLPFQDIDAGLETGDTEVTVAGDTV
ncbi:MAG: hypothetical protein HC899_30545 [Leptolyngbyaceae cyanobacterium SM1_4_3]|nr:hypothetical protein [Leptolyngbyaceae cyanobacterium SM1_4_3]NJN90238.1 hypothetical protein [Leptolyngbyaceae cyanobacterium SL_5_14]NJO67091.1 hypothetical protein [Leptolyngbyaceae cyanobacterium RM1_405_57]